LEWPSRGRREASNGRERLVERPKESLIPGVERHVNARAGGQVWISPFILGIRGFGASAEARRMAGPLAKPHG
jgi:hypothetical protein